MRPRSFILLALAAFLTLATSLHEARTQAVRTDIACDPARRDDNPSCAFGARCVRIAQDCGIWASFCTGGNDLLDACKLFCRSTIGRCELQGAACTAAADCRGRGECREGRCMAATAAAPPRAECRSNAQCAAGQACIAGLCSKACRLGVSDPCADGEGCLAGRCVPL